MEKIVATFVTGTVMGFGSWTLSQPSQPQFTCEEIVSTVSQLIDDDDIPAYAAETIMYAIGYDSKSDTCH